MNHLTRFLALYFAASIVACSPTVRSIPGPIPPAPPGTARIILYREIGYYEPADVLRVALNQQAAGVLPRGDVLYRDVVPGSYTITFTPTRPDPNQFKTVTLAAGEVAFVKIQALPVRPCNWFGTGIGDCDLNGYIATVMNPAVAQQEIQTLTLIAG